MFVRKLVIYLLNFSIKLLQQGAVWFGVQINFLCRNYSYVFICLFIYLEDEISEIYLTFSLIPLIQLAAGEIRETEVMG